MRNAHAGAGLLAGIVLLVGCGEDGSTCEVGQSIACACTDGRMGAQVCGSDGRFGECECTGATPTDAGAGSSDAGREIVLDAAPPAPKRVFVTEQQYRPTAAPEVCQNAAEAAELGGTWVPWLSYGYSTGDDDAIDAVASEGPWNLPDGETAFRNKGQLGTVPSVPINVTEWGDVLTEGFVWTGTFTGGTTAGHHCQAWTENDGTLFSGLVGTVQSVDEWTESHTRSCDERHHVYCLEQ